MGFINYLINGISLGSVYAIIALGYTMVYGIAKMLNFAHGDVIMIGSYVVFVTVSTMGLPPMAGVLLAVAVCTLLGMTIERIAYKPLRGASPLAVLITAIGVSYLLQNVALLIFGADTKSFTSVVTLPAIKLAGGEMTITGETIVTILSCIVIMIGLTAFINKSKAGQAGGYPYGNQCKRHHCPYICHRFRAGGYSGRAALLRLPVPYTLYWFHAGYQGLCCGCIRRNRIHSGCFHRRYPAGCH